MSEISTAAIEIAELNLGYLLLVQRLINDDLASAMFRLGLSREVATLLGRMSLTQIVRIANAGHVIFGFRLDEKSLGHAISPSPMGERKPPAHMAILLARQSSEAAELAEAA